MHSTTVLPHKMAIVLRPQTCDVISPYVAFSLITALRCIECQASTMKLM